MPRGLIDREVYEVELTKMRTGFNVTKMFQLG